MRTTGWCLLIALAGCDGSNSMTTPMGNTVTGTAAGVTINALGALFFRDRYDDSDNVHHELAHLVIGESADMCAVSNAGKFAKKNTSILYLAFEGPDGSTSPVGVAEYPVWNGPSPRKGANVIPLIANVGADCDWNTADGPGGIGNSGSVNLTTSTDGKMAGTFSLSFAQGQVSGSFDAAPCPDWLSKPDPTCQ